MSSAPGSPDVEALERALRVSDQSCSAYAFLRDRYRWRSTALDLSILLLSAWLTAMVFVQPEIGVRLSPTSMSKDLWLGLLSIGAFGLSLVQLQVNWKGRALSYQLASAALSSFVKEHRSTAARADSVQIQMALAKYQVITDALEPIPDAMFLTLKKRHALKVEVSRHLDKHPSANIWLLRLRLWFRDNTSSGRAP